MFLNITIEKFNLLVSIVGKRIAGIKGDENITDQGLWLYDIDRIYHPFCSDCTSVLQDFFPEYRTSPNDDITADRFSTACDYIAAYLFIAFKFQYRFNIAIDQSNMVDLSVYLVPETNWLLNFVKEDNFTFTGNVQGYLKDADDRIDYAQAWKDTENGESHESITYVIADSGMYSHSSINDALRYIDNIDIFIDHPFFRYLLSQYQDHTLSEESQDILCTWLWDLLDDIEPDLFKAFNRHFETMSLVWIDGKLCVVKTIDRDTLLSIPMFQLTMGLDSLTLAYKDASFAQARLDEMSVNVDLIDVLTSFDSNLDIRPVSNLLYHFSRAYSLEGVNLADLERDHQITLKEDICHA